MQTTREEKKVKSIYTMLSIWNTMMGSTLIRMPYFISQAGIIPSIIILFIYGLISFYTARIVVKTGGKDNDYADTVFRYFGLWFLIFDKVFSYCDSLERWFQLIILLNMLNKKFINIEILDEFLSNLILITLIKFGDREMCSLFFKYLNSNSLKLKYYK